MRALGWVVAVLCLGGPVVAGPDAAKPAPKPAPKKTDTVDISSYRADLVLMTDDDGTVYVARPVVAGRDPGPVFVGDGKVFYQQLTTTAGGDGSAGTWSYGIWAPRVPGYDDATLYYNQDKKFFLACGADKTTELRPLTRKESDRILHSAEFHPRLWARRSHLLARDDDGTYYYVDMDIDEHDGSSDVAINDTRYQHGHRVFVGKKGAMKELPMTNVVSDSDGEIYQTKRGELRIVTHKDDQTAVWVRGRKKLPLKLLPTDDNRYLIYRGLGIYGFMGTACEEL